MFNQRLFSQIDQKLEEGKDPDDDENPKNDDEEDEETTKGC
jgi:hypothetical protein